METGCFGQRGWRDLEFRLFTCRTVPWESGMNFQTQAGMPVGNTDDFVTYLPGNNRFQGEHCCESTLLLNQILREEWEYDGVVISDWGAVHDTRKAALSGLDVEISVTFDFEM